MNWKYLKVSAIELCCAYRDLLRLPFLQTLPLIIIYWENYCLVKVWIIVALGHTWISSLW